MSQLQISVNFNVLFSWHYGGNADPERSGPEKVCHKSERAADVFLVLSASISLVAEDWDRKQHTHNSTQSNSKPEFWSL